MKRWSRFVSARPRAALASCGALTLLALLGLIDPRSGEVRLRIDPSLNEMLPSDDEGRREYEALRRRFGSDDTLVVAVEADDLFTNSVLHQVVRLTRRLETLDGVRGVHSLANAPHLRSGEDGVIDADPVLSEVPEGRDGLHALRDAVLDDPLYAGRLVSRDGRMASLVVELDDIPEPEFLARGIDRRVGEAALAETDGVSVWLAGTPHVKAELSRILTSDLAFIVPATLLLMVGLSALFFRTLVGAWLPVGTAVLALVWTLGAMAWAGHALNIITTIVPPLVLIVGFAYVIHVVAEHGAALRAAGREAASFGSAVPPTKSELLRRTIEGVSFPILLTGLTTAAGFLSLTTNSLPVIREFGVFSAVGVLAALVASLCFAPAVLALGRAPRVAGTERRDRRIDRAVERLGRFDIRHRWLILGGGAALFVGSLLAMPHIVVSTEIITNFEPDAAVRQSYEAINEGMDGADTLFVTLDAPGGGGFKEPVLLQRLEALQEWLERQPEIGGTTSIADHVKVLHRAFRGGGDEAFRIPDSRSLIAQLLFLGGGDELEKYVDAGYASASVTVRSTSTSSREIGRLADRIEHHLVGAGLEGSVTGNSVVLSRTTDDISVGQAWSLTAAFAAIYGILSLYFRSPRLGLIALLPNALPVAIYFGTLGVTGITLNNATALMGCIVLGIAVDDTIHFMVQFRRHARRLGCESRGAIRALQTVGRPVTLTTVVLCVGLLLITTSDLRTQAQFGALGAFTLAVAWLVDVVITPALCSVMNVVDADAASSTPAVEPIS